MPNRPRYRLHAMLARARCFGTEPVPGRALAKREALSRNHLPALLALLARLPVVRRASATDRKAAYTGHPAAVSWFFRGLRGLGAPPIPRMITQHAYSITGIDIHTAC